MKDFKSVWKQLASKNNVSNSETFQFCILRAMAAKHEDKEMLASYFIDRAYTPVKNNNKLDNGMHPRFGLCCARRDTTVRTESPLLGCLETEEEKALFWKLADINYIVKYEEKLAKKNYIFAFVRGDISPEYQAVQVAHATCALGFQLAKEETPLQMFNELHLVVCSAKYPLEDICRDINQHGYGVVKFCEPDMGNELTAICSYPIQGHRKDFLRHHNLLKFPEKVIKVKEITW